jgi:hypothetical protein
LKPSTRRSARRTTVAILLLVAWIDVRSSAQSVTVSAAGEAVHVRAPGFGFIRGEPLARLKDGLTVRVDLELAVLPKPGATPLAQSRRTFVLSYDLWEERFAVTQAGEPPRSISHQTATAAEAWCIEQLTVPLGTFSSWGLDRPFWVRLEYRVLDGDAAPVPDESTGLRWLIDALSRRRKADALMRSIEAGPLKLPK